MTSVIPIPIVELADPVTDPNPAEPAAEAVEGKCERVGCTRKFQQGAGRVPELKVLYALVRNTDVLKSRPLTRLEVLAHELCTTCAKLAVFRTYPTLGTLDLMARWAEENVACAEGRREREYAWELRQRERNLQYALAKPDDKGFVNQTLAESEGRRGRRHHKKLSRRQQREQAALKHRTPKTEEGGKGKNKKKQKSGDKQKGGKGKGR